MAFVAVTVAASGFLYWYSYISNAERILMTCSLLMAAVERNKPFGQ